MVVDAAGAVSWIRIDDHVDPAAPAAAIRTSVPGATRFDGGEGVIYDEGLVYLTTKGDDRVWVHDVEAETMTVLYDASEHIAPVLNGVDNLAVSAAHDLYVAEDGGKSEEHTSELQSLMRISYAVFCLKKKKKKNNNTSTTSTNT